MFKLHLQGLGSSNKMALLYSQFHYNFAVRFRSDPFSSKFQFLQNKWSCWTNVWHIKYPNQLSSSPKRNTIGFCQCMTVKLLLAIISATANHITLKMRPTGSEKGMKCLSWYWKHERKKRTKAVAFSLLHTTKWYPWSVQKGQNVSAEIEKQAVIHQLKQSLQNWWMGRVHFNHSEHKKDAGKEEQNSDIPDSRILTIAVFYEFTLFMQICTFLSTTIGYWTADKSLNYKSESFPPTFPFQM